MDEPIFLSGERSPYEEPIDHGEVLENALKYDDKNEFLMAITHPDFVEFRHVLEPRTIFLYDAVRIATAVFEGETEGIYHVKDMLRDGMSPIHLAAGFSSPKLTKYLIERGDCVDVECDVPRCNLKQASPIELALESMESILFQGRMVYKEYENFWTPRMSLLELLVCVCNTKRHALEVVRLLIQNTQNKERVKQSFMDYADKGKLVQLAALLLAAPDLFLPSLFMSVRDGLSSLEKRTYIEEGMFLLLDVFAAVGDKLVAYVRVEDPNVLQINEFLHPEIIAFLLREVAYEKRVSSRNDYFLRFFKPVDQLSSPHMPKLHQNITLRCFPILPFQMQRYDINIDYINRNLSSLKPDHAADVYRGIENKLSSMARVHGLFREIEIIEIAREKYLPEWFPVAYGRKSEAVFKSLNMKAVSTRPEFEPKFRLPKSLEKIEMHHIKLNSFFSLLKKNNLPMVFKRFIRG